MEQVTASHILVKTLEEATQIYHKVSAGEDFAELAKAHSSCPSSARGGDLGPFGRGRMVTEFDQASFSLGVGQISGPVQTQFGYHIIKRTA